MRIRTNERGELLLLARGSRARVGLTFLELLIAVVILVVVIVAILQLFDQDVTVRKQQDQMAELQQNLRAAMDMVSRDVRTASACGMAGAIYARQQTIANQKVKIALPIAVAWMTSAGPYASTANLEPSDKTRPDGIGILKCAGNGPVELDPAANPKFTLKENSLVTFKEPMGLQPSDEGKFLIFWIEDKVAYQNKVLMPQYVTAQIKKITKPSPIVNVASPETVQLGPMLKPTNDQYATFGKHWTGSRMPAGTQGKIANFDPSTLPVNTTLPWKCAMVEWVEYIIDKWGDNDIPHSQYSKTTREGSVEHPLLVRRVNTHEDPPNSGTFVPDWDVIGHDIEDMQVVYQWDPDGDPANNVCPGPGCPVGYKAQSRLPGLNLEYQAGDPGLTGPAPSANVYGIVDIADLCVDPATKAGGMGCPLAPNWDVSQKGVQIYQTPSVPSGPYVYDGAGVPPIYATPLALRKARITLLARTRDRDFGLQKGAGSGGIGGFPGIEDTPNYFQGSAAISKGPAVPPLYLPAYRRRALTSELALRNYIPGGVY